MLLLGIALGLYFGGRLYRWSLIRHPERIARIYKESQRASIEKEVRLEMEKAVQAEMKARLGE